jgi:hypothetical protein
VEHVVRLTAPDGEGGGVWDVGAVSLGVHCHVADQSCIKVEKVLGFRPLFFGSMSRAKCDVQQTTFALTRNTRTIRPLMGCSSGRRPRFRGLSHLGLAGC